MSGLPLTLVSHHLCPYVQRIAISLTEKAVPFERSFVDLSNKPAWFLAISPLGKTPVLQVGARALFESAVILEYLEETRQRPLHPADPLDRAEHRAWIEYGSSILNDIAGLYSAVDSVSFEGKAKILAGKFARMESVFGDGPFFDGERFCLVDCVFAPVFRYFDIFDQIGDFGIIRPGSRVARWRRVLAARPSVASAVTDDYPQRLTAFLLARNSHISRIMQPST